VDWKVVTGKKKGKASQTWGREKKVVKGSPGWQGVVGGGTSGNKSGTDGKDSKGEGDERLKTKKCNRTKWKENTL